MTVEELAAKVLEVRRLQKAYFKYRCQENLTKSKAAEAELDKLCEEIANPKPTLFDPEIR